MGITTSIEWTDSSLNLMMGCDGCELWNPNAGVKHCYAGVMTEMYGGRKGWPVTFDQPEMFPERLNQALKWPDLTGKERSDKPGLNGYPRTIFLDDMGDTFTESLPMDWLVPHIPAMADSPHIYQFLTKRPARMYRFFYRLGYIPNNFWLMTSVTEQKTVRRIKYLLQLREINPGVILGLSCEPLLGPLDLEDLAYEAAGPAWAGFNPLVDWVIVGGESGPNARPCHPDWVRGIRDQCTDSGVAFFFKQWGEYTPNFGAGPFGVIDKDGKWVTPHPKDVPRYQPMFKAGKKAAGRLLDGVEWSQFPLR